MIKIARHYPTQSVTIDGEVETYCNICGKDWGYYNTEFKWLLFKMWLHSLKISIRRNK